MRLVKPSYSILSIYKMLGDPLKLIEVCARTCYKSEDKITHDSAEGMAEKLINLGHYPMLEHSAMTVRLICDRGISHEIVRHRLCSFAQESTRYCNYKGGVTFVIPPWLNLSENNNEYDEGTAIRLNPGDTWDDYAFVWTWQIYGAEQTYLKLLKLGWSPEKARCVLPNSLKTELVITANFTEWRHIFKLRCSKSAHPQMRELMIPLFNEVKNSIPIIFDDITY